MAQGQYLGHYGAVVILRAIALRLLAGAGVVSCVELLAQCAALGKLHHGQVAGYFQRELVAFFTIGLCRSAGGLHHVCGYACHFFTAGVIRPVIGRIQRVFAELLHQLSHTLLNLGVTLFVSAHQFSAAQHKAAQGIFQRLLLLGIQAGGINRLVFGIEPFIRAQTGKKFSHHRQHGVVSIAQLGRFMHTFQMPHCAPSPPQPLGRHIKRQRKLLPVGRKIRLHCPIQPALAIGQQLLNSRLHLRGCYLVKQG